MKRGIRTTADLRARSRIDPHDRNPYDPCWHWTGANSGGVPKIWTFCHDRGEKCVLQGPRAVWNIARNEGLGSRMAYRGCFCADCVNPNHVKAADNFAQVCEAMIRSGVRKGTMLEQRRANAVKARAAKQAMQEAAK